MTLLSVQFLLFMDPTIRVRQLQVVALAAVVAALPVRKPIFRWIQRSRRTSPSARRWVATGIACVAVAYLTFTAFHQRRDLFPKYHDSQSYAIQAQIIASGRLWLPPHALPEFFDTFHVLMTPVYCSMYFPGAAMAFAPGVWLDLPWWVIPILLAGAAAGLTYRVMAEVVDGFAGLLAALWTLSLMYFRNHSTMLFSHMPALLLGLAIVYAWLRWRRQTPAAWGWALAIGAAAGWAAITRPADALAYAAPVGVAMLFDLRNAGWRRFIATPALVVLAAAPFLVLQLVFNRAVSGDWLTSPYRVYLDRDAPQLSFGFHAYDPKLVPASPLSQKQLYHTTYNRSLIEEHRPDKLWETWTSRDGRLKLVLEGTTPALLLLPLLLFGLLGLSDAPRRVLFAVLPLYCGLYLFYAALLRHYTPVVAPPVILLGLLGARQLEAALPRVRRVAAVFSTTAIVGMCVLALPELNRMQYDDPFPYPEMNMARQTIPSDPRVKRPALVFVKFTPAAGQNVHSEPVYNWDAAKIDDNPIVFAHDLGPRNVELIRYYAERQPQRHVCYYDRHDQALVPAGTVTAELDRLTKLGSK